ncbi:MAG: Cellobiose 2-epimerase [Verrucomicrobia subdivision 3 bacterium]|nr:Cellobiose 2-epimerase [Limisphaerales bacterium]MCS1415794.1 Cellobiose 2-epimerase [Limisphaerales bacterium]
MHKSNRLAKEKSPYLLQHQYNPVDWFPWGEAAFEKARAEDKPLFLSIGYSTCHWCHVMERESFEDERVADFLNEHFVSIKVDREERPDVDKIYMTSVQALSGQGGWPLSVFLTGDLKPFYGGTYFPPSDVHGRPGFLNLLHGLNNLWCNKRNEVTRSSGKLHQRLAELCEQAPVTGYPLNAGTLDKAAELFRQEYDPIDGGFGRAPKFPRPSQPAFLLRYGVRQNNEAAIKMVLHTCERMSRGGMYDQIGGGFARYSVDSKWLVPHFEKMLYDNAQLIHLYLDAYLVSGEERFVRTVRETLDYVRRDMTHPEGGFYSAEDADSEGKEGKFYCWTLRELKSLLQKAEVEVFIRHYGVTEKGNFIDHSDPDPLLQQNVLSVVDDQLSDEERKILQSAKAKVFAARGKRVRPHLDDKILVSWNGLMLGAVARTYGVLGATQDLEVAERNFEFLWHNFWDEDAGCLHHRWREGERDTVQLFQGYAYFLSGVIDLYEVTIDPVYLKVAIAVADAMIERFFDHEHGGFWQSDGGGADLILRMKEDYDGAEPSGNSVAMLSLQKLAAMCDRTDYIEVVEKCFVAFAERLDQLPQAVPLMLLALDSQLETPRRIVIHGDRTGNETQALIRAAQSVYQPNKVVLGIEGAVAGFVASLPGSKKSTEIAYLCTGQSCQEPTSNPAVVQQFLRS